MDRQRRWDELNIDCLLNVFGRLGMEELLNDVPFVCKLWHKASHNPSCWKSLTFPDLDPSVENADTGVTASKLRSFGAFYDRFMHVYQIESSRFSIGGVVKLVVKRSNGHVTAVTLPQNCISEVLTNLSDVVPGLKTLSLWCDFKFSILSTYSAAVQELITDCTSLETLSLKISSRRKILQTFNSTAIMAQSSIHCKNLVDLRVLNHEMCKYATNSIANILPKLKYLRFRKCEIERDDIIKLLLRCTELEILDMRDCIGFKIDDEISKLASHISTFVY